MSRTNGGIRRRCAASGIKRAKKKAKKAQQQQQQGQEGTSADADEGEATAGGTPGSNTEEAAGAEAAGQTAPAGGELCSKAQYESSLQWRRSQARSKLLYKHYKEGKPLPEWAEVGISVCLFLWSACFKDQTPKHAC